MAAADVLLVMITMAMTTMTTMVSAAGKGKGYLDPASTNYLVLEQKARTGQERFFCLARGRCHYKIIQCPRQCPHRKPAAKASVKACFADCSSRCETTCKNRLPNCEGFGSVCYDPRFVGGDGVMFYFHGAKGGDFALVSDDRLQINVHFIGTRPAGRARDFTWVQALALMFDSHTLVIAARRVAVWDDGFDALAVRWDGRDVVVPPDGEAEWLGPEEEEEQQEEAIKRAEGEERGGAEGTGRGRKLAAAVAVAERTGPTNSIRVSVPGLLEMDVKVVPITAEDDRAHGYGIPAGDAFAHLETQFRFAGLTDRADGILGQTYRPDYVSPVKKGVAMPMMGGEDRYRTPSFLATSCPACRFRRPDAAPPATAAAPAGVELAQY